MRHQGCMFAPLPPLHTPVRVCFPAKGEVAASGVEARGGDALLFTRCFALFLFIYNFVFFTKIQIDKTSQKRSFKLGALKAGRTVQYDQYEKSKTIDYRCSYHS
jgi:hypothetical protein